MGLRQVTGLCISKYTMNNYSIISAETCRRQKLLMYIKTFLVVIDVFYIIIIMIIIITIIVTVRIKLKSTKLRDPQPVTKFPTFYGIRRFITLFITARHLLQS